MNRTAGAVVVAIILAWAIGYAWGHLRGLRRGVRDGRALAARDWIIGNNFIFAAEERRMAVERDPWAR